MGNSCGKPNTKNSSSSSGIVEHDRDLVMNPTADETTMEETTNEEDTTTNSLKCQLCVYLEEEEEEDDNANDKQGNAVKEEQPVVASATSYCNGCAAAYCAACWKSWVVACEERRLPKPTCMNCRTPLVDDDRVHAILGGRAYQPAEGVPAPDPDDLVPIAPDLQTAMHDMGYRTCPNCQAWIERRHGIVSASTLMECLCGQRFCFDCGLRIGGSRNNNNTATTCQCIRNHNDEVTTMEEDDDLSDFDSAIMDDDGAAVAVSPDGSSSSSPRRWIRAGVGRWVPRDDDEENETVETHAVTPVSTATSSSD